MAAHYGWRQHMAYVVRQWQDSFDEEDLEDRPPVVEEGSAVGLDAQGRAFSFRGIDLSESRIVHFDRDVDRTPPDSGETRNLFSLLSDRAREAIRDGLRYEPFAAEYPHRWVVTDRNIPEGTVFVANQNYDSGIEFTLQTPQGTFALPVTEFNIDYETDVDLNSFRAINASRRTFHLTLQTPVNEEVMRLLTGIGAEPEPPAVPTSHHSVGRAMDVPAGLGITDGVLQEYVNNMREQLERERNVMAEVARTMRLSTHVFRAATGTCINCGYTEEYILDSNLHPRDVTCGRLRSARVLGNTRALGNEYVSQEEVSRAWERWAPNFTVSEEGVFQHLPARSQADEVFDRTRQGRWLDDDVLEAFRGGEIRFHTTGGRSYGAAETARRMQRLQEMRDELNMIWGEVTAGVIFSVSVRGQANSGHLDLPEFIARICERCERRFKGVQLIFRNQQGRPRRAARKVPLVLWELANDSERMALYEDAIADLWVLFIEDNGVVGSEEWFVQDLNLRPPEF